ncbi:acyl-CoA dehydrogenase family protein [Marinithermus hydrothermalis]|uniref:Acyl-CoA dehydrogenase n=1 Tax=Marinithermus hydrothermalis (strain DSM 14884 / JCM 11576 / T1) TaxID=869210 RepID=F2NKP2_MARHT|nr:acyl-CoA dehydrogenase family protein [Marinithermus hydrothermalis]AEB10805.1 Acyl-CoA dehydrogenase [Marinithermus hydrothermalis DSM 14884]
MEFSLTPEQRAIQTLAQRFAREVIAPQAAAHDQNGRFPAAIVEEGRRLGLVNLRVPEAHGGGGLGVLEVVLVAEALAWGCVGIAAAMLLNNLAADALRLAGTPAQQRRYYARLAEGFAAYALTEPHAGSDAAAIRTRARPTPDGYVLTGRKTWISNAPVADFFVVFAKTDPEAGHAGISAFLVDREQPGVRVGPPLAKLGQRAAPAAEVVFDEVSLSREALLGREGEGFKLAMRVFDHSRPMVAAFAVGLAQRALDEALRYATQRTAFGQPIARFQGVGFKLAEMGMHTQAARLLTYHAAWKADQGQPNTLEAAYAKAFAADHAMQAALEAVQIHGGYGYSPEYPVEKLMRDAKLLQIYEGTSEIQRVIMTRELVGRL